MPLQLQKSIERLNSKSSITIVERYFHIFRIFYYAWDMALLTIADKHNKMYLKLNTVFLID